MLSAVGMYGRAVQDGRAAVERALLAPSLRRLSTGSGPTCPCAGRRAIASHAFDHPRSSTIFFPRVTAHVERRHQVGLYVLLYGGVGNGVNGRKTKRSAELRVRHTLLQPQIL